MDMEIFSKQRLSMVSSIPTYGGRIVLEKAAANRDGGQRYWQQRGGTELDTFGKIFRTNWATVPQFASGMTFGLQEIKP